MIVRTPQSRCRAGLAHADITPPVGMYHRMWGAAKHDRSTGIHQPLRATALALGSIDGGETNVIVALDHCILGPTELDGLLTAIEESCGIDRPRVFVTCSHTHAAGLLSLDRVDQPGGDRIPEYLETLGRTVAETVGRVLDALAPVSIVYGRGHCDLAARRDLRDETTGEFVCGFDPTAAADDTVVVARIVDDGGATVGTVVNYACHPTTLAWDNTLVSPDYPGTLREVVERETGAPCLFLQGASGELGPRDGFVGETEVAERNGRQLAFAALSAVTALPEPETEFAYTGPVVSGATIGTWGHRAIGNDQRSRAAICNFENVALPLPYRTDLGTIEEIATELERLRESERQHRDRGDDVAAADLRAQVERRRRNLARRRALPPGETYPYRAIVWRLGEAVWIGVQGEPYSLLQTELRRRFPETPIIATSIGWDWSVAYLPPRELYGRGIYQESIAILAPGSLERVIEELATRIEATLG